MRVVGLLSLLLVPVLGACPVLDGGDFFVDDGFDGFTFTEVSVDRRLAFQLDAVNPTQRYQIPVTISPPSSSARIDASFSRIDGVVVGELNTDGFANESPSNWSLLEPLTVLSTFSSGNEVETFRLSLATNDPPAFVDVRIVVTAPADVDFDGLEDGVVVDVGAPSPFIP